MRQISANLSTVLRTTAENLIRRGTQAGADGRLWAAIGAARVVADTNPLRATAVARELKALGCDIDPRGFASQLLRSSRLITPAELALPSLWTPLAQAILEMLERPDVSKEYGLCDLWAGTSSAANE